MYHCRLIGLNVEQKDLVFPLFLPLNKIIESIWRDSNSYVELCKSVLKKFNVVLADMAQLMGCQPCAPKGC